MNAHPHGRSRGGFAAVFAGIALTLALVGGTVQAGNTRSYSVSVSTPTAVSVGAVTEFDVNVISTDNQTLANVVLRVPAPAGTSIVGVFGVDKGLCPPLDGTTLDPSLLVCDFGNIAAFGHRSVSVLARISVAGSVTFSPAAETNNENGTNSQVAKTDVTVTPSAFDANKLRTFDLGGSESTSPLGTGGNLQTTLHLLQNNGGSGNSIDIAEQTLSGQPAVCVSLKVTCQLDVTEIHVNGGVGITPYLETILTAKVPKTYSIKKAFVLHTLDDGSVQALYNTTTTSCVAHPALVPCADFSITKDYVLTITVHTATNGKFNF